MKAGWVSIESKYHYFADGSNCSDCNIVWTGRPDGIADPAEKLMCERCQLEQTLHGCAECANTGGFHWNSCKCKCHATKA